jgi:hypothetical protein
MAIDDSLKMFAQFSGDSTPTTIHEFLWFGDPIPVRADSIRLEDGKLSFSVNKLITGDYPCFLAHFSPTIDRFVESINIEDGRIIVEGVSGEIVSKLQLLVEDGSAYAVRDCRPSIVPLTLYRKPSIAAYPRSRQDQARVCEQYQRIANEELIRTLNGVKAYEEAFNMFAVVCPTNPAYDDVAVLLRLAGVNENFARSAEIVATSIGTVPEQLTEVLAGYSESDRAKIAQSITPEFAALLGLALRLSVKVSDLTLGLETLTAPTGRELKAIDDAETLCEQRLYWANCLLCDLVIENDSNLTHDVLALTLKNRAIVNAQLQLLQGSVFSLKEALEEGAEAPPKFRKPKSETVVSAKAAKASGKGDPSSAPTSPTVPPQADETGDSPRTSDRPSSKGSGSDSSVS